MQQPILWLAAFLLLVSCNQGTQKQTGLESETILSASIEELVSNPEEFQDREIALSGMVTHVCRHGGQKCFVLAEDGETQIRVEPGEGIDEFKIELEGSTVAFKGTFRVLNAQEAQDHIEDHDSKEHHATEMSHSKAEKADIFLVATDLKEITE
jgi:hypothetical protein